MEHTGGKADRDHTAETERRARLEIVKVWIRIITAVTVWREESWSSRVCQPQHKQEQQQQCTCKHTFSTQTNDPTLIQQLTFFSFRLQSLPLRERGREREGVRHRLLALLDGISYRELTAQPHSHRYMQNSNYTF